MQATILTAFNRGGSPNRMPVTVVEFDQDSETGEPIAAIITAGGTRAYVKRSSLQAEAAPTGNPVTEPGMYTTGEDIYKVQAAKDSGNLYAKRLVPIGGKRLAEDGSKVRWEFQYAPGAVRDLRADQRLSLEQAKAFGIQFGFCVVCGAFLKDADSVAAGIGPVCAGRL